MTIGELSAFQVDKTRTAFSLDGGAFGNILTVIIGIAMTWRIQQIMKVFLVDFANNFPA